MNQQQTFFDFAAGPERLAFPRATAASVPHARTKTSADAAAEIRPHAGRLRERVFEFLCARGEHGATDQECQDALQMPPQTQGPRRIELMRAGLVRDSGQTRPTRAGRQAVVWVAVGKPFPGKGWRRPRREVRLGHVPFVS